MLVRVVNSLEDIDSFDVNLKNIREILNYIKFVKGKEYTDKIINEKFNYILVDSKENLEPLVLLPEVILSDIIGYDTLFIVTDIKGEEPISATTGFVVAISAATGISAGAVAFVANMAIMMAVSFALNTVMSLLSPTPQFSSDPSTSQTKQSNLFNGAPAIREQGGSMPIIFGNCFCGGVLISSSVQTYDTPV